MAEIGIAAIAEYLPSQTLGNAELVERFGFDLAFLEKRLGISERHIAADEESVSDMAVKAGEALLDSTEVNRDEIGILVICTQNPDYRLPSTANLVQHRLHLPIASAAFDINQGCSGFVYGIAVAQSLMTQQGIGAGLLITTESYSKVLDPDDRSTVPLFGDGAAATLLRAGARGRIGKFTFGSDGSGADDLIVRAGGSRAPAMPVAGDGALRMNGRAIYNFMMRRVPENVTTCLAKNGLELGDIDLFVFHQASRYMIESLASQMKIPAQKVVIALDQIGNTVSSTIPMAMLRAGGVSGLAGKRVLICGFGVGLSWASTVVDFR